MAYASLIVYVIAMLVRPHEWGVLVNNESSIVRNSLLVCLAFFLFHRHKNLGAPQFALMIVLLLAIFISVTGNGWIGGGIQQAEAFARTAFVPFFLISALVDSPKKQNILFLVIVICSLFTVLNGHVQVTDADGIGIVGNPVLNEGGNIRIRYLGYMSDPNDLGMFLVMCMPLVFILKNNAPKIAGFIFWGMIGALVYGIFLTNSRGTLLATLSLVFFWIVRKYGVAKSAFFGAAISPALLVVLSSFRQISAEGESAQGRLDAWYVGIQLLLSSPIWGVGKGSFTDFHRLTAHNSFVLSFAELGILGCLSWAGLLVASILTLMNISKSSYLPEGFTPTPSQVTVSETESKIAIAMLYSLVAYMVSGFFLSRTYAPVLYLYLGMSAACLGRVRMAYPKLDSTQFFKMGQIAKFTLIIVFGTIVTLFFGLRILI